MGNAVMLILDGDWSLGAGPAQVGLVVVFRNEGQLVSVSFMPW